MRKTIRAAVVLLLIWASVAIGVSAEESGQNNSTSESQSPQITSLAVKSYPDKTIYDAFEEFDKTGLELVALYDDGSSRAVSLDEIDTAYQKDTCFRVGDSHIFLSFEGASVSVPVTVNRIEYDLSALSLSDFTVTYNGKYNSLDTILPDVVGKDGIALSIKVLGGGTSVGKYDVSIDFETESRDYYTPYTKVVTMTIEPFAAEVVWENLSFVYDGKSKVPTAYFIDAFGNKIYPAPIGSATNAGKDYTAKVVFNDPNYLLTNTEAKYEIKKADYNFLDVVWSRDSCVYDGTGKSISVSGLPAGVRVVSYVNDRATDAGKYTVTAKLAWEEDNYNAPSALTHTWEISPAEYDISGFSFLPGEYTYDGNVHYPKLQGKMPVGADGISLEYSFSAGACHVSDGTVSSTIVFTSKSKNYVVPAPMYSSVTVLPLGVVVEWSGGELRYSGAVQAPTAISAECLITVKGGETNVGKYTAEAYSENTDYAVVNPYFDYSIIKAENRFLGIPEDIVCYEGRQIELPISARFGEVQFVYYSDPYGKNVISAPATAGIYYAKAVVFNTENYTGIESKVFSFVIEKIVAVSFFAALSRAELRAYELLLPTDLSCTVVNNDGSREAVDSSLVSVVYQSGDSLRRSDEYVTIKYGKFNFKIDVEVDFADYDLGGVAWADTVVEYDGKPKTPTLVGLPDGVSVKEYIGGGAVYAGKYTVCAVLDYDSENYNQPKIDGCSFTIKKKCLEAPTVFAVYSGEFIFPESDSSLYYFTVQQGFKNAGKYTITATLNDGDNYEFVGGGRSCAGYFVITPRVICVEVEGVTLHLFEKLRDVEYRLTGGECVSGETLSLSKYVEGKRVKLRSDDPNYTVISSGGDIKRLPYPTLLGGINILIVLVFFALLALAVYLLLLRRHRLQNAVAIIKCRWHNRNLTVFPPRRGKQNRRIDPPSVSGDGEDGGAVGAPAPDNPEPSDEGTVSDMPDGEAESETQLTGDETEEEKYESAGFGIDAEHADALITDSLAKNLINKEGEIIYTDGKAKNIVNVDTLSQNFTPGDRVDVNSLKNKSLVPYDTAYIKVLARGMIDKPLSVYANDFSLSAVKMIALTGGEAIKAITVKNKNAPKVNDKSSDE